MKDLIELKELVVSWVPTGENLADFFTKKLPRERFCSLRDQLMGDAQDQSWFSPAVVARVLRVQQGDCPVRLDSQPERLSIRLDSHPDSPLVYMYDGVIHVPDEDPSYLDWEDSDDSDPHSQVEDTSMSWSPTTSLSPLQPISPEIRPIYSMWIRQCIAPSWLWMAKLLHQSRKPLTHPIPLRFQSFPVFWVTVQLIGQSTKLTVQRLDSQLHMALDSHSITELLLKQSTRPIPSLGYGPA